MEFFDLSDFDCPCCGKNNMDSNFLRMLDRARGISGVPFNITSGCRCKAHNEAVGGSETSSHLTGYACDISATNGSQRFKIVTGLLMAGFRRIGVRKDFVHADNDLGKSQKVLWVY